MSRYPGVYLRGMAMGAADVVPGVSGGTLALITGIYEELIDTLGGISWRLLGVWRREGFLAAWRAGNLTFLATLLGGIITSILLLASLLTWLMEFYPVPLWAFFCGLIGASLYPVLKPIRRWDGNIAMTVMGGAFVAAWITSQPGLASGGTSAGVFFVSGAVAICAMILPGISGSFILLLLGMYAPVLEAVHERQVLMIAAFMAGCAVGLLSFVHLLKFLLHRYHDLMMALLAGFMGGSLVKLWPWRVAAEPGSLVEHPVSPAVYAMHHDAPAMVWPALGALLVGVAIVVMLTRFQSVHNEGNAG